MLKVVNMPEVKTVFLEEIEKLYREKMHRIIEAASGRELGAPLDEGELETVIGHAGGPNEFACVVEGLLDDAIELCSEFEYSETSGVTGKLEKFTLKDSFALSIDVMDSPQNSVLLYEMKQEKYVRIESVQAQLALDDGAADSEEDVQMELGDEPGDTAPDTSEKGEDAEAPEETKEGLEPSGANA